MPVLTLKSKKGSKKIREYKFDREQSVKIGRSDDNDVIIDDISISGSHARIEWIDNDFLLTDTKSTNGTFVNNEEIVISSRLKHGDIITFDKYILVFTYAQNEIQPAKTGNPMNRHVKTKILSSSDIKGNTSFRSIKNVYIVGNPIKSNDMFFGRDVEFRMIKEKIANQGGMKVILLKGGRRSGKTSILYQIFNGRIKTLGEAAFCDFHHITSLIETDEDLPFQMGNAILSCRAFQELRDSFINGDGSWTAKLGKLIRACLERIAPGVLILLWDEYETLEELFKSGKLTNSAINWANDVKDLPVYFIMTGSKGFGDNLSPIFSDISEILDISLLSNKDTMNLIRKPVEGYLDYQDETVQRIYQLSGGYPFYVQYLCHTLVSEINLHIRRDYAVPEDMDRVIQHIIRNPVGHIQETWKSVPWEAKSALAALAHTQKALDEYTEPSDVFKTIKELQFLKTAKRRSFSIVKGEYRKGLAQIKEKTPQLLDFDKLNPDRIRFNINIFRYWIRYHFQSGEFIEEAEGEKNNISEEGKSRKWIVLSSVAVVLLLILLASYKMFFSDTTPPEGKISGIEAVYTVDDTIDYTVNANDDKCLSEMTFEVHDTSVKKRWDIEELSASRSDSFPTAGWNPGSYRYSLEIKDNAGNPKQYKGSFDLKKKESVKVTPEKDTRRPEGKITGISDSYTVGDTISYSLRADDDRTLKRMMFQVHDTSVKERWNVGGQSADQTGSFSTLDWPPGSYRYSLEIEDKAGNSKRYAGMFVLKKKPGVTKAAVSTKDIREPAGKITGISDSYTVGDTISYSVRADDDKSLSRMTFEVHDTSVKKRWNVGGRSADQIGSFPTAGWNPGSYRYSLLVEDKAGRSKRYAGRFVLEQKPGSVGVTPAGVSAKDTRKPEGKITGISDSYTVGDTISYSVRADDDRSLSRMTFEVHDTSVKKKWKIGGQSANRSGSFSTAGWSPGSYRYSLLIEDKTGHSRRYAGKFVLEQKLGRKGEPTKDTREPQEKSPGSVAAIVWVRQYPTASGLMMTGFSAK